MLEVTPPSALHLAGAPERCVGTLVPLEGCHGAHRAQQRRDAQAGPGLCAQRGWLCPRLP